MPDVPSPPCVVPDLNLAPCYRLCPSFSHRVFCTDPSLFAPRLACPGKRYDQEHAQSAWNHSQALRSLRSLPGCPQYKPLFRFKASGASLSPSHNEHSIFSVCHSTVTNGIEQLSVQCARNLQRWLRIGRGHDFTVLLSC